MRQRTELRGPFRGVNARSGHDGKFAYIMHDMLITTHDPNVRQVSDAEIVDPGLREVIERAAITSSPPPSWYRTMGHNPEVAKEFARYWDMLHRGGTVDHRIKELCRIQIAQMVGCEFCSKQSSPAAGITEERSLHVHCRLGSTRILARERPCTTRGHSPLTTGATQRCMPNWTGPTPLRRSLSSRPSSC
jgi:hypothetical protein